MRHPADGDTGGVVPVSGLLAAIGLGLIGLAIGAAIQRWGDADRATHGHQDYDMDAPSEWFI